MNKYFVAGLTTAVLMTALTGCASMERELKTFESEMSGGLERTVSVYSHDGDLLKSYEGKIDIQTSENKVLFDLNGKRNTIYNAIVIVEEQ